MKKFLLIFICANIVSTAYSMEQFPEEQLVDFNYVLSQCPDTIASILDRTSFASLTQTCKEVNAVCDSVPTKYFGIDFSDAVAHKNYNLIARFIAKYDDWMCEPGTNEVVAVDESDKNNIIKTYTCSFGKGLQNFLGDYNVHYVSINDKPVRYLFGWKDSEKVNWLPHIRGDDLRSKNKCAMYLNVDTCNNRINEITAQWIRNNSGGRISVSTDARHVVCSLSTIVSLFSLQLGSGDFYLTSRLCSSPDFFKKLGVIVTFFVAAMKKDIRVIHALLNNQRTFDILPGAVLRVILNNSPLISSKEIQDMIEAALKKDLQ